MNIQFDFLEVKNVTIKGKDSLVRIAPMIYKELFIIFTKSGFSQVQTYLGSMFSLKLNTDGFNMDSCKFN